MWCRITGGGKEVLILPCQSTTAKQSKLTHDMAYTETAEPGMQQTFLDHGSWSVSNEIVQGKSVIKFKMF